MASTEMSPSVTEEDLSQHTEEHAYSDILVGIGAATGFGGGAVAFKSLIGDHKNYSSTIHQIEGGGGFILGGVVLGVFAANTLNRCISAIEQRIRRNGNYALESAGVELQTEPSAAVENSAA